MNKLKFIKKDVPDNNVGECEDCISRKTVIDAFNAFADEVNQDTDIHEAIEIVLNLPPVTPAEKVGKWILIDEELSRYKCSECGEVIKLYKKSELSRLEKDETLSDYPFSHCGCRMIEPYKAESEG